MKDDELDSRLMSLEMKVSYLEDFLNQVQQVAVEQAKTIEKLTKENKLISQRLREVADEMEGEIPNRKPPHY